MDKEYENARLDKSYGTGFMAGWNAALSGLRDEKTIYGDIVSASDPDYSALKCAENMILDANKVIRAAQTANKSTGE